MSSRFRWTLTNLGDSTTEILSKDPLGWEDMTLRLSRDKLYHGVFIDFSLSLKWHCRGGGKEFIDNVIATEDVNGIVQVLIEIDCDGSGTYTGLYTGRLDLASYSTDGEYTTCMIEKGDLYSKLKARDQVSVDLETTTSIGQESITAPDISELAMHSQLIFLKSSAEAVPYTSTNSFETTNSVTQRGFVSPLMTTQSTEAENFFGVSDWNDFGIAGPDASSTLLPEIFEATDDDVEYPDTYTYRLRIRGLFKDEVDSTIDRDNFAHALTLAYGPDLNSATKITLFFDNYSTNSSSFQQAFDTGDLVGTIVLNYGDKIWLYWFENEVITTGPYVGNLSHTYEYDEARFSIEINSFTSPSLCKSLLVHEAFNQVCDAIADTDVSFYSDFYGRINSQKLSYNEDGCGSMIAVTNGLNIRQFSEKSIYCSLRDLFETFNAIHNIGLTIERYDGVYTPEQDTIRVEQLSYFYDKNTATLVLPSPVKVETVKDNSRYINNINTGYDKWESEYLGGLDEPNTRHEYSTKNNAIKGQYSKLSKYMASGYAIEATRRKSLEESKDWRHDNNNFVIAVKKCGVEFFVEFVDPDTLRIYGAVMSWFAIGEQLSISGSSDNDGSGFNITSVTDGGPNTQPTSGAGSAGRIIIITVSELILEESATCIICNITRAFFAPELKADAFSGGSGMVSINTAYNLRLTPARMLLAHMNAITACLQIINGLISFVKGEGNTALITTKTDIGCQEDYNGTSLEESQSFDWNDTDVANIEPLWIPEIYKFTYPLTASQLASIRANPLGYIQVTDDHGEIKKGYVLDVDYHLKTGLTKFELLRVYE